MSRTFRLSIFILPALFAAGLCNIYGQSRPGERNIEVDRTSQSSIRGRVLMPDGSFVAGGVKETFRTLRDTVSIVYPETQGQFEFPDLLPANYQLEVEADRQRYEVVTENVQVFKGVPSVVTITLKPIPSNGRRSVSEGSVSVNELRQQVPAKARKEFERASEAGNAGRTDEAIAHLRKAIALFPDFVRAHNDLGTYLLALGKLDEAAEELTTAASQNKEAFYPALNLGIVLVHKQQFSDAANSLPKALALEPASPAAHLYAGQAFMGLGRSETAEKEFKDAYSLGGQKYAAALF